MPYCCRKSRFSSPPPYCRPCRLPPSSLCRPCPPCCRLPCCRPPPRCCATAPCCYPCAPMVINAPLCCPTDPCCPTSCCEPITICPTLISPRCCRPRCCPKRPRRNKRWPQCNFMKSCIDKRVYRNGEHLCLSYAGHIPGEVYVHGRNLPTATTFAKRRLCKYTPYEFVDHDGCCSFP